jgi:hypothetical protein
MPSIEMTNGQVHDITDPSTAAGCIRRMEAAASSKDSKGEEKEREITCRFKDSDDDMIGVVIANVSSVY